MIRVLRTLAFSLVGLLMICCSSTPHPSPSVRPAPQTQADPPLSPGDVLRVTVWHHPDLSGEYAVTAEGTLFHPLYQEVKVVGIPLPAVKERLRSLLATYEQDVQLAVQPLFPVTVAGEVRTPNMYRLPEGTTVAQAVATAGGPTERGRMDLVHVVRGQQEFTLDLTSSAASLPAAPIRSGDQIFVGHRSNFNFVRDVIVPIASLTGAIAAIISVSRQ